MELVAWEEECALGEEWRGVPMVPEASLPP
jgi:hypothetical protein